MEHGGVPYTEKRERRIRAPAVTPSDVGRRCDVCRKPATRAYDAGRPEFPVTFYRCDDDHPSAHDRRSNPYVSDATLFDRDALIESLRKRGMTVAAATRRADELMRGTLKRNPETYVVGGVSGFYLGMHLEYAGPTEMNPRRGGRPLYAGHPGTLVGMAATTLSIDFDGIGVFHRIAAHNVVLPTRDNPGLILWSGNPPPEVPRAVEAAWCTFHGRDEFSGSIRDVGRIPGAPEYAFALGRLHALDVGHGDQSLRQGGVWVVADTRKKLWIVSERTPMDFRDLAGVEVVALTYTPMRSSGKDPAHYQHHFENRLPVLAPVGPAARCRAVKLERGSYDVDDWIRG